MEFTGYKTIVIAVVAIEILVILMRHRRNPVTAVYTTIISLVLKGQYIWLGIPLYAWQFSALIGGLLHFTANPNRSHFPAAGRMLLGFKANLTLFFIYSFVISVVMWPLLAFESGAGTTAPISFGRIITQSIYALLLFGLLSLGIKMGRYASIASVARFIVLISTIIAYFAILQVVVFFSFGINLFPIIGSDDTIRSAFILDSTFRATSVSGEPKHLGITMALGLTSFFVVRIFRIPPGRYWVHKPIVMLIALILSLSATGIYLTLAAIGFLSVLFVGQLRKADIVIIALATAIVLTQIVGADEAFMNSLSKQVSKKSFEIQDETVFFALLNNPLISLIGAGLGNIHVFAIDYIPEDFPLFRDRGYKANSGLLYILGDSGIIGLSLFLIAHAYVAIWFYQIRPKLNVACRRDASAAFALLLASLIVFLLRFSEIHFFICGIIFTNLAMIKQRVVTASVAINHRGPVNRISPDQAIWPRA